MTPDSQNRTQNPFSKLGFDQQLSKRIAASPPPETRSAAKLAQPSPRPVTPAVPAAASDGLTPAEMWEDRTLKQIYRVALKVGFLVWVSVGYL